MATASVVLGTLFVVVLIVGVIYAAVSPILQPIVIRQIPMFAGGRGTVTDHYALIKGVNVSQNVESAYLNVTVKFGTIFLAFSNDVNLVLDAIFSRGSSTSQLSATYETAERNTEANLLGEAGALNVTLGRNVQYSGSLDLRLGGIALEIGQYSEIDEFDVRVRYFGGILVNVTDGASFRRITLSVNTGGVQSTIHAQNIARNGEIDAGINMGGFSMSVDVDTHQVGVSLEADVDVGGISVTNANFTGPVSATHCSVKTIGYSGATRKIDVTANVGLGGVALQEILPFGFGRFGP